MNYSFWHALAVVAVAFSRTNAAFAWISPPLGSLTRASTASTQDAVLPHVGPLFVATKDRTLDALPAPQIREAAQARKEHTTRVEEEPQEIISHGPRGTQKNTATGSIDSDAVSYVDPPEPLASLAVGETCYPYGSKHTLSIERVALNPPIFVARNFLNFPQDRDHLMNTVDTNNATRQIESYTSTPEQFTNATLPEKLQLEGMDLGFVSPRPNSNVSWVDPAKAMSAILQGHNAGESIETHPISAHEMIAGQMTLLVKHLFMSRPPRVPDNVGFGYEHVQLVHYAAEGGKFNLHHDKLNRTLTALTYLNGVAGTWFPFAEVTNGAPAPSIMQAMEMVGSGSAQPGQDGILLMGSEQGYGGDYAGCNVSPSSLNSDPTHHQPNPHVVNVNAGDAVVFYNYDMTRQEDDVPELQGKMQQNRRALHVALETSGKEKWIATNWLTVR